MLDLIAIILLGVLGLTAAYFDLKKRIVPNYLSLPLLFASILLLIISNQFKDLAWMSLFIIIDYALYSMGVWAGGDFKLTVGIIGILLFYSERSSFTEFIQLVGIFFAISFGIVILMSVLKRIMIIKENRKEIILKILKNSAKTLVLTQSVLFLAARMELYQQILLGISVLVISLFVDFPILITGIVFVIALIVEPLQTIEKSVYSIPLVLFITLCLNVIKMIPLKKKVLSKELEEGMILEGEYYLENNKLKHETSLIKTITESKDNIIYSDKKARGLTEEEIGKLRKYGFESGFQKITIRLSPFLIIASLIMLIIKIA
ncbi:Uncharacterised protein [uncultured archaeon]|nr:Uncharacterised protein [uncultured archaeon]